MAIKHKSEKPKAKSAAPQIVRRKKNRLTGHANFVFDPFIEAAFEMRAADEGVDKSDLYRDALKMYCDHHGIDKPGYDDVLKTLGPEWLRRRKILDTKEVIRA